MKADVWHTFSKWIHSTHCNDHCLFTVLQGARNCSRFLNAQKTPFSAHKVHFAKLDAACCASCKKLDAACCASCKKCTIFWVISDELISYNLFDKLHLGGFNSLILSHDWYQQVLPDSINVNLPQTPNVSKKSV